MREKEKEDVREEGHQNETKNVQQNFFYIICDLMGDAKTVGSKNVDQSHKLLTIDLTREPSISETDFLPISVPFFSNE